MAANPNSFTRLIVVLAYTALFATPARVCKAQDQTATGTVCVASRSDDPFRGQVIPRTGKVDTFGLEVKIDKRPAISWPERQSLKIEGLDASQRHLLVVLDAHGKAIESVWFRFTSYKSLYLCMQYDGYQGIGLDDAKKCPWCKCK